MILSDNGVSKVWRDGDYVYKEQPQHLTQNEIWCLYVMCSSGYVPKATELNAITIRLDFIKSEQVTDKVAFMDHYKKVLEALEKCEIRHGDLTHKNVLVNNNKPIIFDFAESRLFCDPRPDKRPDGDSQWLKTTMEYYIK